MHLIRAVSELSGENNYFRDDQLCYTPGVTERRVENGNPMLSSKFEIDLVGTNTEAADYQEALRLA